MYVCMYVCVGEMCRQAEEGMKRKASRSRGNSAAPTPQEASLAAPGAWECKVCKNANAASSTSCENCGSSYAPLTIFFKKKRTAGRVLTLCF